MGTLKVQILARSNFGESKFSRELIFLWEEGCRTNCLERRHCVIRRFDTLMPLTRMENLLTTLQFNRKEDKAFHYISLTSDGFDVRYKNLAECHFMMILSVHKRSRWHTSLWHMPRDHSSFLSFSRSAIYRYTYPQAVFVHRSWLYHVQV